MTIKQLLPIELKKQASKASSLYLNSERNIPKIEPVAFENKLMNS